MNKIILHDVTVTKNARNILQNINTIIPQGAITTVLGRNGSGKSTLLRAISGIEPCTGKIEISGSKLLPYLPAYSELTFDYQVKDIILAGRYLIHKGYPTKGDEKRCLNELTFFGFESLWTRNLFDLSSGERQIVFTVRALASDADFFCFDEPFSHLDIGHEIQLRQRMRELTRNGIGFLLIEHHLSSAVRFGDHFIFISNGKLTEQLSGNDPKIKSTLEKTFGVSIDQINEIF